MSCVGLSCVLSSCVELCCELCICVCVCVRCVSMCTLRMYVFIIPLRADGGAGPRVGAKPMAFCRQGMLTFQATNTTHCILPVHNANFVTQDMSDPMFDISRHVIQKSCLCKATRSNI